MSDDVAYTHHDLQDGLRAGLFEEAEVARLPVIGPAYAEVDAAHPGLALKRRRSEALRRVFGAMVGDVIGTTRARLDEAAPVDVAALRALDHPVVAFSQPMARDLATIRAFLFERMYRAPAVMAERARVTRVIEELFPAYLARPDLLPEDWQEDVAGGRGGTALARIVADYVAGMTDRFALQSWRGLAGGPG